MMKRDVITVLCTFLLLSCYSNISSANAPWTRFLEGFGYDRVISFSETCDNGFFVSGVTESDTASSGDVWLDCFNLEGKQLWRRTFDGIDSNPSTAYQGIVACDNGSCFAGYVISESGDTDIWLLKINDDGYPLWTKTLYGTGLEIPTGIVSMDDNSLLVSALTQDNESDTTDISIFKLDSNGNLLWRRTFDWGDDDFCCDIIPTGDGRYTVAGTTYVDTPGVTASSMLLFQFDENGDILWENHFDEAESGITKTVRHLEAYSLGFILYGQVTDLISNKTYPQLLNINTEGQYLYTYTIDEPKGMYVGVVDICSDGYILGGTRRDEIDGDGIFIAKEDISGIHSEHWKYSAENLNSLAALDGGGFAFTGIARKEAGAIISVFMAVTDTRGNAVDLLAPVYVECEQEIVPVEFALSQNLPNPFNATTTIPYSLDTDGQVSLTVYDSSGRKIATLEDSYKQAGVYSVVWNGMDNAGLQTASGIYFCRLMQGEREMTTRMLFVK